ncbi:carboxypeptidase-like regulatory domain-containing protein [Fibrisoma montanum]|uniref:Carboxypeptidase-like regulatory domain-containing protein n=1 Tax=Fibrisoma montanum TaxID=2305895 RepID=A0A418LVV5_9BACT|nr:carboxypeptidase-like regulatory domain-containing protein [Fibrisoma montanum]RIV17374.1 carboxypeptidase-like regulatory domain-containing protein [Fibrisoma montanum]
MLLKAVLTISVTLLLTQFNWAQTTIRGQVQNGNNQEALPFANVFLSGTTKGTMTDQNGSFTLLNVPSGKFDLIVSYVGFATLKTTIQTQEQKQYRFILKPLANQLDGITITARRRRDANWAKQLSLFTELFIGRSQNARYCQLLNPQVLSFSQRGDTLRASAQEPLLVENRALGYRIKFQLEHFAYTDSSALLSYQGDPVFEPLTPATEPEAKRWQANRQKAYFGSLMHFGRALYRRQLAQEGFTIQKVIERTSRQGEIGLLGVAGDTTVSVKSLTNPKRWVSLPMAAYRHLLDTVRSTALQSVVAFSDLIQVIYTKEKEPYEYQRTHRSTLYDNPDAFQKTLMRMLASNVTVEANGQFWPPRGIRNQGYWAWELMADELPFDYDPKEGITRLK